MIPWNAIDAIKYQKNVGTALAIIVPLPSSTAVVENSIIFITIGDEAAGMVNQSFPIILGNNKIQTNISGARKINVGFKLSLASFACICFICGSFFFNFASLTLSLPIIADLSSLLYDDTSFDIRFVPSTSENLFRE